MSIETSMLDPLFEIRDVLLDIRDLLEDSFKSIPAATSSSGSGSSNPMAAFERDMGKTTKKMGGMISGMLTSALGPIAILAMILKGLSEPFELITDPIKTIGDIISLILYPILQPLSDKLYELAEFLAKVMTELEPYMPMIEYISALLLDLLINVLFAKIQYIYNKVMIWFGFIMTIVQSISDLFTGKIDFATFMSQIWAAIVKLIGDLVANFIAYIGTVWTSIMGVFSGLGIQLVDWFKQLPATIINGLKAGWNSLGNWWDDLWS